MLASSLLPGISRAEPGEPEYLQPELGPDGLPPLADRLPRNPRVINMAAFGRKPGKQGGSVRTIIGGQKDIRLMTICSYARLVGYDEKLQLHADILESFEV